MLPYTAVDLIHAITADLVPEGEPDPDACHPPATNPRRDPRRPIPAHTGGPVTQVTRGHAPQWSRLAASELS